MLWIRVNEVYLRCLRSLRALSGRRGLYHAVKPLLKTGGWYDHRMQEEKHVLIRDLAVIIDREIGTIRGWERDGRLPKKLRPRRNERDWRYWTPAQVEGIKDWMKRNDMRPGSALAKPENEKRHLENLRQPKLIQPVVVRKAYTMSKKGKTQLEIAEALLDSTGYNSVENFLKALAKAFKKRKWKMPPYDEEAKQRREELSRTMGTRNKARAIVARELGVKRLPARSKRHSAA